MEIALGGALVFHALNGLRVIVLDFWEDGCSMTRSCAGTVAVGFVLLMLPLSVAMLWPFLPR